MSTIEEQLARDIAAVTGGIVVTESELKGAREVLVERVDSRRKRHRRRIAAALVTAAVVIPIVGVAISRSGADETAPPAGPVGQNPSADDLWLTGGTPTQDLVQGVWREDNGTVSIRFSPPDTVSSDNSGRLFDAPAFVGTYEIAGDVISISVDGGAAGCAGDTFAMRASMAKPGVMRFVPTQAETGRCSLVPDQWGAWEHVLPAGPSFAHFHFPNKMNWEPWPGPRSLYGMWAAEGGGYALEIDRDGSYYVADGSGDPIDRGQWSYRHTKLTLTSAAGSVECGPGDQVVLSGLEQVNSGTLGMQWTVKQNACGGAWASQDWFLVPHEGS
jgi:hypothetical protein